MMSTLTLCGEVTLTMNKAVMAVYLIALRHLQM